jgi:hypothetical protein
LLISAEPQQSVEGIMMSRLFLDLREWNARPNGSSSTTSRNPPTMSFRAATRRIGDAIVEDVDDSWLNESSKGVEEEWKKSARITKI